MNSTDLTCAATPGPQMAIGLCFLNYCITHFQPLTICVQSMYVLLNAFGLM